MCPCTDLTHEDVRRLIKARELKSMPAVWQELGWRTPNGCHSCRPVLNFYLLADWPLEYRDDPQSRFVNERNHANIQKDGTFSVVPRMWGGVTTPAELRAIADAAEQFTVPMVKVTGGQRIDLLGVRKEDLPAIWADLGRAGLVSGHAYSKGLRTVKTCVGTEFCRFGTQELDGLGHPARKAALGVVDAAQGQARGLGLPAQLRRGDLQGRGHRLRRLGVRARRRRRRGDGRQGDRAARQGRDRGRGGRDRGGLRAALPRAREVPRPALQVGGQVGMDWVRVRVVDDRDERRALVARFDLSQSVYQKDPWAERATPAMRRAWSPLADLTLGGRRMSWIDIGAVDDIPLAGARVVRTHRGCVAVFRTAGDEVFATSNACPHRGGPLSEGIVHGRKVTCPLHNWIFSLETGEAQGADEGRLATCPARVEAGRVLLDATSLRRADAA